MRALWPVLALLPLQGCCAISQSMTALFCGPRKAPWVRETYETPRMSLNTFTGAVARVGGADDPKDVDEHLRVLYRCFGEDLKRRMGFGEAEFRIAWERLVSDTPGLNLADQADVTGPFPMGDGRIQVRFRMTLETMPRAVFDVYLRRQPFWSLRYLDDEGVQEISEVPPRLGPHLQVLADPARSPVRSQADGAPFPGLTMDEIVSFQTGHEWKIDGFQSVAKE